MVIKGERNVLFLVVFQRNLVGNSYMGFPSQGNLFIPKNVVKKCICINSHKNCSKCILYTKQHYLLFQGTAPGTFVAQLKATDADSDANGNVTYHIVEGGVNKFIIDNVTGVISTTAVFDRESGTNQYTVSDSLFLCRLIVTMRFFQHFCVKPLRNDV